MNDTLQIKFGLTLLFITAFLTVLLVESNKHNMPKSIADKQEPPISYEKVKAESPSENNDLPSGHIFVEPTPFIKQQGKAEGNTSIVKFEKDLETSLKVQEVPDIWLEYRNENNEPVKVEIPVKAKEFIKKRWLNTLDYTFQNQNAADLETKVLINKNYINDATVFATTIDNFQINTSLEKRNISTEEAFDLMSLTANLAIERYKELQNMASQINPRKITE